MVGRYMLLVIEAPRKRHFVRNNWSEDTPSDDKITLSSLFDRTIDTFLFIRSLEYFLPFVLLVLVILLLSDCLVDSNVDAIMWL
mmetsp:Transcript_15862/g.15855  ORF Transcript_15862/g.15855 Transcript_15862/m.15855 type:complete len:84 (-) Transcript_15862:1133-1384(-)